MSVTLFFMVKFINLFFVDLPPSVSRPPSTQEQQGSLSLYLSLFLSLSFLPLSPLSLIYSLLWYAHCPSFLLSFRSCPLAILSFSNLPTSLHAKLII